MSLLDLVLLYHEKVPPRERLRDFVRLVLLLVLLVSWVVVSGYWAGALP